MSKKSTGSGFNPAFLREIKEDNVELRRILRRLRNLVARPNWWNDSPRPFLVLLGQLRDQLAVHFSLEEFYGYLDAPLENAPRLCSQCEGLLQEHRGLYVEIHELTEWAEMSIYDEHPRRSLCELGLRFRDFDAKLRYHEARENELLLAAFDDDIGVGD